jgi:hypothetical protein
VTGDTTPLDDSGGGDRADGMLDREELEELERLAAGVGAAIAADPPPPEVLAAARRAWEFRMIDAELAELVNEEAALLRADHDLVTYAAGDVFIDMDRTPVAGSDATRLTGHVTAPVAVTAVVLQVSGDRQSQVTADLDASGGFRVESPGDVPTRLLVELVDHRYVVSPWLR